MAGQQICGDGTVSFQLLIIKTRNAVRCRKNTVLAYKMYLHLDHIGIF